MACCVRIILSLISFLLFFLGVQAGGAAPQMPHQLYGKSVTISRVTQLVSEDEATGRIRTVPLEITDSFYFSSLGRIFARVLKRVPHGSRTFEQVGSDPNKVQRATSATGSGQTPFGTGGSTFQDLHFEGRTLIAVYRVGENGAARLTIEFDQSFGTCTVSVVYGSDNGQPRRRIDWTGRVRRAISSNPTSQPTCVVKDGNIFE
jgi:hypothetical protein